MSPIVVILLWILLGGLACGVLLELLARWWIRRRGEYYVFPPGYRLHLVVDLEQAPGLDPLARFEINRDGERGPEPPREKEGLFRILTCGGSAAEGYLLDEERSWAGALREILMLPENLRRLGARRVHVGSVGRSRTGAEALDLIFEKTLPRYDRLAAIVIMVGATDVVEWFEAGAPERWTPPPVRVQDLFAEHPESRYAWSPKRTALYDLLRRSWRRLRRPLQLKRDAGKTLGKVRAMRARAKTMLTEVPPATDMLDHFERHMLSLVRRAQRHADMVLVLGQPCFDRNHDPQVLARFWDFAVGNPYQVETDTYFSMDLAGAAMRAMNERARKVAAETGTAFVDLGAEIEPGLDLYYDFLHFTPKGAETVARIIAREILARAGTQRKE